MARAHASAVAENPLTRRLFRLYWGERWRGQGARNGTSAGSVKSGPRGDLVPTCILLLRKGAIKADEAETWR